MFFEVVDFVFDVRCLPNPYWKPGLRALTGKEKEVQLFLDEQPEVQEMLTEISSFAKNWVPRFQNDNRSYMTFAIGCTGGHHRSVYIVEHLANKLASICDNIQIRHRELQF